MGKLPKRRRHPSGYGHISPWGYHVVYSSPGKRRHAHTLVWEHANGPVPDGHQLHHINGDKLDNRLANLQLLTPLDHKREHSPHYRRDSAGAWERQCRCCEAWLPATTENYYFTREGWLAMGHCRPCHRDKMRVRRAKG